MDLEKWNLKVKKHPVYVLKTFSVFLLLFLISHFKSSQALLLGLFKCEKSKLILNIYFWKKEQKRSQVLC